MTTPKSQKRDRSELQKDRRVVRKQYRDLTTQVESEHQALVDGESSQLLDRLSLGNELFKKVKTTQDAIIDSQFLLKTVDIAVEKAQKLKLGGIGFDLLEFVDKVKLKLKTREGMYWDSLAPKVTMSCTLAPTIGFMYGPIQVEAKAKAKRKQAVKLVKDTSLLKKPDEITTEQAEKDANQTNHNVELIFQTLQRVEPVPFYKFIMHPSSFSQSVENLFYFSFLIRDGIASVYTDEETNELMVETGEAPGPEELQSGQVRRLQNMLHLDMNSWKNIIEKHGIKKSIIPHRETVADVAITRWT